MKFTLAAAITLTLTLTLTLSQQAVTFPLRGGEG